MYKVYTLVCYKTFAVIAKRFALKHYFDKCKTNNVKPI